MWLREGSSNRDPFPFSHRKAEDMHWLNTNVNSLQPLFFCPSLDKDWFQATLQQENVWSKGNLSFYGGGSVGLSSVVKFLTDMPYLP